MFTTLSRSARLVAGLGLVSAGVALAAPADAAPADAGSDPLVTCNGHHVTTLSPGLTNLPTLQMGNSTFKAGSHDLLAGPEGSTCTSSVDPTIDGATMTIMHTGVASCTQTASTNGTGSGYILWSNGQTSTVTDMVDTINDREQGDGILKLTGSVADGEFAGKTLTVHLNHDTAEPELCGTTGIGTFVGSDTFTIR